MLVYLDASVWVKRYVIEEGSRRVREWFKKGPIVATSSLALIEVMSTLVRKDGPGSWT
ncbi:MAG: type II toxin-antitoxin system VapC family toxin [Salinibacter sp.]